MGDKEGNIQYTPEELQEIERIINLLPQEAIPRREAVPEPQVEDVEEPSEVQPPDDSVDFIPTEESEEQVETIEDISDLIEPIEEAGETEVPAEETGIAGEPAVHEEIPGADEFDEMPDMTSEPGIDEAEVPAMDELPADEIQAPEEREEVPEQEEIEEITPEDETSTPLDELDALTSGEPESVDQQDISDDRFVEDSMEPESAPGVEVETEELGDLDEISQMETDIGPAEETESIEESEIPEISADELHEIPETMLDDSLVSGEEVLPADLEGTGPVDELDTEVAEPEEQPGDVSLADDMESEFDDIPMPGGGPEPALDTDEDQSPDEGVPGLEDIESVVETEDIPVTDEAEEIPETAETEDLAVTEEVDKAPSLDSEPVSQEEEKDGTVEISDRDLRKLKKALLLFHPELRKAATEAILNDLLPPKEISQLIDMIISGKPEENIQRFLEKKLKTKIDIESEVHVPGRRIITSRPEYTREGIQRQKKLLKATKIFGIAAAVTFLLTILGYQFVY